jgi:NDP-sugar pyrophosphorylase family protein
MEVIIPLAGLGTRLSERYSEPKPFIKLGGKTLLEISMLGLPEANGYVFVCRQENFSQLSDLVQQMPSLAGKNCRISVVPGATGGQAETVMAGLKLVKANAPIVISNCDTFFSGDFVVPKGVDGAIGTFESDSPAYSYVAVKDGLVTRAVEKEVISNRATSGLYYFSSKDLYLEAYQRTNWSVLKEKYVAPMYNCLSAYGLKVKEIPMERVIPLGTEAEIDYALESQNLLELIG